MTEDWSRWSRESVALVEARNRDWHSRFGLHTQPYRFDLETATLTFDRGSDLVVADLTVIGTTSRSEGTFLWSWANDSLPAMAASLTTRVRAFGEDNDLPLLTRPEWPAARPEGLEMLAISARILDAAGCFVHESGDVTYYFALFHLRETPKRT
jgi:hypothetical protein